MLSECVCTAMMQKISSELNLYWKNLIFVCDVDFSPSQLIVSRSLGTDALQMLRIVHVNTTVRLTNHFHLCDLYTQVHVRDFGPPSDCFTQIYYEFKSKNITPKWRLSG